MSEGGEPLFPLLRLFRLRMGTDGAGVTTLAAGAGCPLDCRWCINREILKKGKPEPVTARTLYERAAVDDLYFRATGGGVTFGGGESLLHAAFIRAFREICGDAWRLMAETSLAVPWELVETVAGAVDEFMVDCKDLDGERYRRYTGGDVRCMADNLERLLAAVGPEQIGRAHV